MAGSIISVENMILSKGGGEKEREGEKGRRESSREGENEMKPGLLVAAMMNIPFLSSKPSSSVSN